MQHLGIGECQQSVLGHLEDFSIFYTVFFTSALLTPGCALTLWQLYWLKQMMFLNHGCDKI